jgi:hypothetical protein
MQGHRKALQQVARIVFGAGPGVLTLAASACAENQKTDTAPQPLPTASATTQTRAPHETPRYWDAQSMCSIAMTPDGIAEGSIACCIDTTRQAAQRDGGAEHFKDYADLSACCNALSNKQRLLNYLYGRDKRDWTQEACFACQEVVGDRTACTPWGPPMPPEMMRS